MMIVPGCGALWESFPRRKLASSLMTFLIRISRPAGEREMRPLGADHKLLRMYRHYLLMCGAVRVVS